MVSTPVSFWLNRFEIASAKMFMFLLLSDGFNLVLLISFSIWSYERLLLASVVMVLAVLVYNSIRVCANALFEWELYVWTTSEYEDL